MIYIYAKNTEDVSVFDNVLKSAFSVIQRKSITLITESRRSFRELNRIVEQITIADVLVVYDLSSLGLNDADIANTLEAIIAMDKLLVVCCEESTYEFGISQPMNKAVLMSFVKRYTSGNTIIIELPKNKRSNSGRNKLALPDNWEELYAKWENKEISSKEFIEQTGLKKASFYNLMTEYKEKIDKISEFKKYYNCM